MVHYSHFTPRPLYLFTNPLPYNSSYLCCTGFTDTDYQRQMVRGHSRWRCRNRVTLCAAGSHTPVSISYTVGTTVQALHRYLNSAAAASSTHFIGISSTQALSFNILSISFKTVRSPELCGSVSWSSLPKVKGHWFDSRSRHLPGLQVWSLVRAHTRGNRLRYLSHVDVSLPLFLLPSLSLKISK